MRPCYKSPAYFQVGWSSLQTGSRKQRNRHRVVGVQTGSLETSNLKSSRKCAQKIFKPHQTAEVGLTAKTILVCRTSSKDKEGQAGARICKSRSSPIDRLSASAGRFALLALIRGPLEISDAAQGQRQNENSEQHGAPRGKITDQQ